MRREVALDGAAALDRQGFLDTAQGLLGAARAGVGAARFAEAQLRIRLAQACMRSDHAVLGCVRTHLQHGRRDRPVWQARCAGARTLP